METLDDKTVDTQPEGFNNTIRWHIGHVLTAAETFMFGREFKQLPTEYPGMFGYGSRPSKWTTEDIVRSVNGSIKRTSKTY